MATSTPTEGVAVVSIVCRGSLHEGLGHVMRSASVATALADAGAVVHIVLIGDESAGHVLTDLEIAHERVASDDDAAALVEVQDPAVVVFDTVWIDAGAFERMRAGRRTASTSPIFDHLRDVDASFSRASHEPDPILRMRPDDHRRGLEYTVVGMHARSIDPSTYVDSLHRDPLGVGVSMGGADAANRTLAVLREILETEQRLLIWIMLGEGYAHSYEELVATVRRDHRHEVILARTTQSMWTVLERCSLVILAGGITTFEAAQAGMPSINLLGSEGERRLLQDLEDAGAIVSIGSDASWGLRLREELGVLARERDRLLLMHRRSRELIDGGGPTRVAACLVALANR